jgi:dGTP triphosphohydrolase
MIEELLRFSKDGGVSESKQETHEKILNICNMEDLISFSSLAHDLGHPPFAHAGERFLNKLSLENSGIYKFRKFDSNFQNLRLLTTLHPYGFHNKLAFTNAAIQS